MEYNSAYEEEMLQLLYERAWLHHIEACDAVVLIAFATSIWVVDGSDSVHPIFDKHGTAPLTVSLAGEF